MQPVNVNRENLFEEMLQEPEEIAMKRKRTRETLRVLQQAFRVGPLAFLTFYLFLLVAPDLVIKFLWVWI